MAKNIEIDDLANAIAKELASYNADVDVIVDEEIEKLAKQLTRDLKNDSSIPQQTGDYKKGFYMKKYGAKSKRRGYTIANKKYQLTHLLERGHDFVGRDGVRRTGTSRAFPHWTQANRKAQDLAVNIRKQLEGGIK